MRNTITLLNLLSDELKKTGTPYPYPVSGLCSALSCMAGDGTITEKEWDKMHDYLLYHKPAGVDSAYWWEAGHIKPRIEWIEHRIDREENFKDMRKFKSNPRPKRNRIAVILMIVMLTFALIFTSVTFFTEIYIQVVAALVSIVLLWEVSRTLWDYYQD